MVKNCKRCNETFVSPHAHKLFCSRQCNKKFHADRVTPEKRKALRQKHIAKVKATRICPQCKQSGVHPQRVYCSRRCAALATFPPVTGGEWSASKELVLLSDVYGTTQPHFKASFVKKCVLVRNKMLKGPSYNFVTGNCFDCGTHFVAKQLGHRQDKKNDTLARFCSSECAARSQSRNNKHKRRMHIRANPSENIHRKKVFARDNFLCRLCNEPVDMTLPANDNYAASIDHIIPLAKGGSHTYGNVQTAHRLCNSYKNDKTPRGNA
jgi:5-methylcytosine-specific restriction endonuclease McrA